MHADALVAGTAVRRSASTSQELPKIETLRRDAMDRIKKCALLRSYMWVPASSLLNLMLPLVIDVASKICSTMRVVRGTTCSRQVVKRHKSHANRQTQPLSD